MVRGSDLVVTAVWEGRQLERDFRLPRYLRWNFLNYCELEKLMSELKNDRFIKALIREPLDRTPVWMMRQAGRYLPEYRATRAQAGDFMSLCKNTELACEVTMQPLERYELDAAILFSDILTIPDAMGLGLYFEEGEGPKFRKPVRTEADIEQAGQVINTRPLICPMSPMQ